jgi:cellulose biosynthesis protein BcsQ
MEKITICIIDKDNDYKNALIAYMKSYCRNYSIVTPNFDCEPAYDGNEEVKDVALSCHVILIAHSDFEFFKTIMGTAIDAVSDKMILLFEKKINKDDNVIYEINAISKCSDVVKIVEDIDNYYYSLNSESVHLGMSSTRLVLCLGLSGGSGTSSVALCIANELSKNREKRVFYLSLDMFESGDHGSESASYERVLFSFLEKEFADGLNLIENSVIRTEEGVWRMPVSRYTNVFLQLNLKDRKRYMQEVINNNKFDYLIVDGSNYQDDFTTYLIENCHEFILVDNNRSIKKSNMNKLVNHVEDIRFEEKDCIRVVNFVDENNGDVADKAIPIKYCASTDGKDLLNNISFQSDISKIVDYIS